MKVRPFSQARTQVPTRCNCHAIQYSMVVVSHGKVTADQLDFIQVVLDTSSKLQKR